MTRKWARADSDTLLSASDNVTLNDSLAESGKEDNEHVAHLLGTNARQTVRFNGDSGANYAERRSANGGAEGTATNQTRLRIGSDIHDQACIGYFANLSAEEKLAIYNSTDQVAVGSGNVPSRVESYGKWNNTASQVNEVDNINDQAGSFLTTSNSAWFTGISQAIARFASMRESFQALTTPFNQRFVDTFSGATLDSVWSQTNLIGGGTFAMVDAINEGFSITNGVIANGSSMIGFNDINPFDQTSAILIGVMRRVSAGSRTQMGFSETLLTNNSFALIRNDTGFTNIAIRSDDGTTESTTEGSVPIDTVFKSYKLELTLANLQMSINGTLDVTKTTNRPDQPQQPAFNQQTISGAATEGRIRYMEVYNTA